jgi:hypothetical protein
MASWVHPDDKGLKVLVPLEPDYADYGERVRDLVRSLALAKDCKGQGPSS